MYGREVGLAHPWQSGASEKEGKQERKRIVIQPFFLGGKNTKWERPEYYRLRWQVFFSV